MEELKARVNAPRPQDVAAKKLARAERMIASKVSALQRVTRSLTAWRAQASRYAKLAIMTDAEVEAARAERKRRAANRPVKRGMKLGGAA